MGLGQGGSRPRFTSFLELGWCGRSRGFVSSVYPSATMSPFADAFAKVYIYLQRHLFTKERTPPYGIIEAKAVSKGQENGPLPVLRWDRFVE